MTVTRVQDPPGVREVLVVTGELDVASGVLLERTARSALRASRSQPLVVDLSGVTFMDSYGVDALMALRDAAAAHDTEVVLRSCSVRVEKVLALTGVYRLFRHEP